MPQETELPCSLMLTKGNTSLNSQGLSNQCGDLHRFADGLQGQEFDVI